MPKHTPKGFVPSRRGEAIYAEGRELEDRLNAEPLVEAHYCYDEGHVSTGIMDPRGGRLLTVLIHSDADHGRALGIVNALKTHFAQEA